MTNTGSTTVAGNVGVSPLTAITGFFLVDGGPGTITGTFEQNTAPAVTAQTELTAAYNTVAGKPCGTDMTGLDLGGRTLTAGVYCYPSTSAQLTGTLTLDFGADPNAVFIFQIGTTLTTASSSSVLMTNRGTGTNCNVFWQVGSSATLGSSTAFSGNILAQASIGLTTSATLAGRALARTAAVTLDGNNITSCTVTALPLELQRFSVE